MSGDAIEAPAPSKERLAIAAGVALLVAGLLLVTVVMPAEYGVDPFGTGARLGLTALGETAKQVDALNAAPSSAAGGQPILVGQEGAFHEETTTFALAPGEGMEYKYRLDKGKVLLFTWTATAPVNYELHAEPDGAPRGYAQTYEKGTSRGEASGTLTVPFTGIHGWFWENKTAQDVTVTLTTAGFYNLSHEFRAKTPTKNKAF